MYEAQVKSQWYGFKKLVVWENYYDWSFAMTNCLRRNRVWSSVQGTDNGEGKERRDEKALADICLMVQLIVYPHVRPAKIAKDAWNALSKAYEDKGKWQYVSLLRSMCQMRMDNFESMDSYISEVIMLAHKLEGIIEPMAENFVAAMLLQGLPSSYDNLVMAITSGENVLNLDRIKTILLDKSYRKSAGQNSSGAESSALYSKGEKSNSSTMAGSSSVVKTWKC
jgi:hypothetical protein